MKKTKWTNAIGPQPVLDAGAQVGVKIVVGYDGDKWLKRTCSFGQPCNDRAFPPQPSMFAKSDCAIRCSRQAVDTGQELAFERFRGCGSQSAAMNAFGARIGREAKALELAEHLAA